MAGAEPDNSVDQFRGGGVANHAFCTGYISLDSYHRVVEGGHLECIAAWFCGHSRISAWGQSGYDHGGQRSVSRFLRPVLDTFQTIPLFVFLIPVLMLFQISEFTALLTIITYAYVPAARYTENGLRQVPEEPVEVARMQGCSALQILWQIKLPMALPVILLGLSQTVLFSFSMLVIAALVGTNGLGQQVYVELSSADVEGGLVAGCVMAFLALIADRILRHLAGDRYTVC